MDNNFKIYILDRSGIDINCKSINNAKGYDISDYVIFPIFIEEKLNEEIDTAQITLENYPFANCLEPKTKIIIERLDSSGALILPYFHMIVNNDNVEEYIGMVGFYTHRINLVEVSAIAQGYHVDNIALTYKLQDVDLNYDLNIDLDSYAIQETQNSNANTVEPNINELESPFAISEYSRSCNYSDGLGALNRYESSWIPNGDTFEFNNQDNTDYKGIKGIKSYKFEIEGKYGSIKNNILVESGTSKILTINIPKIKCFIAKENGTYFNGTESQYFTPSNYTNRGYHHENAYGTWEFLTYCETITIIKRTNNTTGEKLSDIIIVTNPQSSANVYQEYYNNNLDYEDTKASDVTYVSLHWNDCKDKIKLCSAGSAKNQLYELILDSNYTYEIETKLNTQNNQAVIYSRVNITSRRNLTFPGGVHCRAKFDIEAKIFGLPFSKTKLSTTPQLTMNEGPLMRQPHKYNLHNMLKKSILTCGDYTKEKDIPIIDTSTNFVIDPKFIDKLKTTPINETIFYEKNLWEVLMNIGYYIHSLPYLEFLNNEQFKISFKELGKNTITTVTNKKISVFSSKDIDEYFGTLDSYVKNLYSPENEIDEYIPFKTDSENLLVSNNSAIGLTSKSILQINHLSIVNSAGIEKDITSLIFEKSVYDTLSFDYNKIPSKGSAIYYVMGTNKIGGITYTAPPQNSSAVTPPMSMKTIISIVFNITTDVYQIKVNDYYLRIKYNTVDSSRLKQFKPNLNEMILNSLSDIIPVHEQFYGQEDKFIDSERYGNLLYGELLKNGNAYYQYGEFNDVAALKEVGNIELINSVPYYISKVESEWYKNIVLQKILYHKDFNSISKIVSIPSEPRFYEISERSKVDREIHLDEFLNITTIPNLDIPIKYKKQAKYIKQGRFADFVKGCLLGINPNYPDYAITKFYGDIDTAHDGYDIKELFVNSYNMESNSNEIQADNIEVQNKLLIYSSQNSLLFEWDMEDNFSAGNYVDTRVSGTGKTDDDAYYGMNAIRYCDLFGRADLFDFNLVKNDVTDKINIQKLPLKICSENAILNAPLAASGKILLKDNREKISFNVQVNMLTDKKICFGRAIWKKKKNPIKIFFLDNELSKFSYQNLLTDIQANVIGVLEISDINIESSTVADTFAFVKIGFNIPDNIIEKVKCIAIVDGGDDDNPTGGLPYIFRNVANLSQLEKNEAFIITPINY